MTNDERAERDRLMSANIDLKVKEFNQLLTEAADIGINVTLEKTDVTHIGHQTTCYLFRATCTKLVEPF